MKVAILDLETTGLNNPRQDAIVEIGACLLETEDGTIERLLDTPVLESNRTIDPGAWIFHNSSLTIEDVLKAPTWDSIKASVQVIFDQYPVTAFNKAFDFGFLRVRGIRIPCEVECIMLAATPICQIPKPWEDEEDPYKWPSATEAYAHFYPDEKYIETHRAYEDCVHEAKILYAILK